MTKNARLIASVSSAALLLAAGVSVAGGPPVGFEQWAAKQDSNGAAVDIVLDYDPNVAGAQTCPANFTCNAAIVDDGFMLRQITDDNTGISYFQTIVTEAGTGRDLSGQMGATTNLGFFDESFVSSANVDGIADMQRIKEAGGTSTFINTSELYTGWASSTGGSDIRLDQAIIDTKKEGFRTDFWFEQTEDKNNQAMRITNRVGLLGTYSNMIDLQDFVFVETKGNYTTTSGQIFLPGPTGGTLAWMKGEDVKATYVGQDLDATLGQTFNFESYDNVSTITYDLISQFSLSQTMIKPMNWDETTWGDYSTDGTPPTWY